MFRGCHNEYRCRIRGAWAWLIARQSEAANQTRIKSKQQEQVNNMCIFYRAKQSSLAIGRKILTQLSDKSHIYYKLNV